MPDYKTIRWGILGTGGIAKQFFAALSRSSNSRVHAVATRAATAGTDIAFPGAKLHVGYDALLADPDIDAVYIATPHPTHAEWAIKAAEAGKAILCEKPLGMNAAEAIAIVDAARRHGVFLMEAFMYRTHDQTRKLVEIIQSGTIGEVKLIHASYGFNKPFDSKGRHFANELGGGGILDIGCYCMSMSRLIAGAAVNRPFLDPVDVTGSARLLGTGVDGQAYATLRFPNGISAQLSVSMDCVQDNAVRIFGTAGRIEVPSPWFCTGRQGGRSEIVVHPAAGEMQRFEFKTEDWLYAIEAEAFRLSLNEGRAIAPAPSWDDTIGNMKALDRWRQAVGLEYAGEKPGGRSSPLSGRPLKRASVGSIPVVDSSTLERKLSKIAIGVHGFQRYADASAVLDAFYEAGGTVFDTARKYGDGRGDRFLGAWSDSRGVRKEITIIGKGAHGPCTPEIIARELEESLESLRSDRIDVYVLHRDNPDVPASEFVDALDREHRAGRIGIFGGSNWSLKRVAEANAYASRNNKLGFKALSNQFSLAEMIDPVWPGCVSMSNPGDIKWLQESQVWLFAWSSQARGFFSDRAGRDKRNDPELLRSWYSEENFRRRDRAEELAKKYATTLSRIALSYVLGHDRVFPIIGPLTIDEMRDSLGALQVPLTPEEAEWLRTGTRLSGPSATRIGKN